MTVERLAALGVRVHCLALGGVDLTSPAGRMTMGVVNAVAEFERDLLIERTHAGLERAKAEGRQLGRRPSLSPQARGDVAEKLSEGETVSALARRHGVSRTTIRRVREAVGAGPAGGADADPA